MLSRLLAFILSVVLLVLGFMFSLVALAVVAVLVLIVGGRLWWKTRDLRRQMRTMAETAQAARPQPAIIEGECVREDAAGAESLPRRSTPLAE